MVVAAWLVWRRGNTVVPMMLFGIPLVFNAAWSWLFFGLR
jgi:tryptophan-rich sensory protein